MTSHQLPIPEILVLRQFNAPLSLCKLITDLRFLETTNIGIECNRYSGRMFIDDCLPRWVKSPKVGIELEPFGWEAGGWSSDFENIFFVLLLFLDYPQIPQRGFSWQRSEFPLQFFLHQKKAFFVSMQRRGWKRIGSGPLFVDRLFINTDADADDNDDDADADADDSDDNADDDKTLSDYISSRRNPK